MPRLLLSTLTALALAGPGGPARAEPLPEPAGGNLFWGMGNTGIMCVTTPCPWTGVFRINPDGSREFPLSGDDAPAPPPLRASDADRARIAAAYAEGACVIVEGRFEGDAMVVARVVGDC